MSDSLIVCFASANKGKKATSQSLSHWIKLAICEAYHAVGLVIDRGVVQGRSTRSISSSWAEAGGASMMEICRAATWSTHHTFVSHYQLELSCVSDNFRVSVLKSAVM